MLILGTIRVRELHLNHSPLVSTLRCESFGTRLLIVLTVADSYVTMLPLEEDLFRAFAVSIASL